MLWRALGLGWKTKLGGGAVAGLGRSVRKRSQGLEELRLREDRRRQSGRSNRIRRVEVQLLELLPFEEVGSGERICGDVMGSLQVHIPSGASVLETVQAPARKSRLASLTVLLHVLVVKVPWILLAVWSPRLPAGAGLEGK